MSDLQRPSPEHRVIHAFACSCCSMGGHLYGLHQEQDKGVMSCSWSWIDSLRWLISSHAARQRMLIMWQTYSFEKWSDFMEFQGPLSQTVIASFLLHFGSLCGSNSTLNWNFLALLIHKQMDKRKWWTSFWVIWSVAFVEKERGNGIWLYLLQSSPTITPSIDPHEGGRRPFSIVYTKVPTHVVDLVKLPSRGNSKSALSFADNYAELFEEIRGSLEAQN